MRNRLRRWVTSYMAKKPPTQIIGSGNQPYLTRWCLLPKNPLINIYIHLFAASDDDRALHDHPWPSLSLLLVGLMDEVMPGKTVRRETGCVVYRSPWHRHRLVLKSPRAITLFIVGPRVRQWGFWCPKGWVHWRDFTDPDDPGKIGTGCGEFE